MARGILVFLIITAFGRHTWAEEPSVDQVRAAALHHAGLDRPLDKWSARSRWRSVLPKVTTTIGLLDQYDDRIRFDEYLTRDANAAPLYDGARSQDEASSRRRVDYSVRADFDLRSLLFDPFELPSSRESRARQSLRQQVVDRVHAAYFERLDKLDERQRSANAHQCRELRRLEAELDGLTGGWFAAQIRRQP